MKARSRAFRFMGLPALERANCSSPAMLNIAVIGSGPAGMYLVEALTKSSAGAVQIDVIDRLPTPYGLVRSGVANSSTKPLPAAAGRIRPQQ